MTETAQPKNTWERRMDDLLNLPPPFIDRIQKLSEETRQATTDLALFRHSSYAEELNIDKLEGAIKQLEKAADCLNNAAIELMSVQYQKDSRGSKPGDGN